MLFNHVRFSPDVKKAIPETSFWFTILRDPLEYFESSYKYFGVRRSTGISFALFVKYYERFLTAFRETLAFRNVFYGLQFDLGFDSFNQSSSYIMDVIEKNFNFVMIAEYFDESLCYLKQQLCWSFEDIVYLKQNERMTKKIELNPEKISRRRNAMTEIIPEYTSVYEHFKQKFEREIISKPSIHPIRFIRFKNFSATAIGQKEKLC